MLKKFIASAPLFFQIDSSFENSSFENSEENFSKILFDKNDLINSIIFELELLFSTRSSFKISEIKEMEEILNDENLLSGIPGIYGSPQIDFSKNSEEFFDEYKNILTKLIRIYEKRITNPEIEILEFEEEKQLLKIIITGEILLKNIRERISFPISVKNF